MTINQKSATSFDELPDSAHVALDVVATVTGVSKSTVLRMVDRGMLPAPKKISMRSLRWNVGELRAFLAA